MKTRIYFKTWLSSVKNNVCLAFSVSAEQRFLHLRVAPHQHKDLQGFSHYLQMVEHKDLS